jgi:hypothetical protein
MRGPLVASLLDHSMRGRYLSIPVAGRAEPVTGRLVSLMALPHAPVLVMLEHGSWPDPDRTVTQHLLSPDVEVEIVA